MLLYNHKHNQHTNMQKEKTLKNQEKPADAPLTRAYQLLSEFQESDHFLDSIAQAGIDASYRSNDDYLELLSVTTKDHVRELQDAGEIPADDLVALQVLGQAPHALRQEQLLTHHKNLLSRESVRDAKTSLIEYNADISRLLRAQPDISLDEISTQITRSSLETLEMGAEEIAQYTMTTLRGIRVENAFEDVLTTYGVPVRHGTVEEERRGVDFVVNNTLHIDIKASLDQVDGKNKGNNGKPYAVSNKGLVTYFPYFQDSHFEKNSSRLAQNDLTSAIPNYVMGDLMRMSQ